ncbi:MAG: ATP-binding protein [Oscillospiraceae bacterium]|nr:ATP-binding protein [Oscillospiraceae bacterium]
MLNSAKGWRSELERLLEMSRAGKLGFIPSVEGLSGDDAEIIGILREISINFHRAVEYDIMKYKLTSDALGIALWDMDIDEGVPINKNTKFNWSKEFRNMLGFSGEQDFPNILSSWSDRLHPEDKARVLETFKAHISDKSGTTPYDVENRLMMKSGEYRYFHAFGTTLRDSHGTPLRVAGALEDITEQKLLVQTLKYREKLLNALDEIDIMLLSHKYKSFEDALGEGLKSIAEAVDLDRIVFYQLVDIDGAEHFGQTYRWDKEGEGFISLINELKILPELSDTEKWLSVLEKGEVVNLREGTLLDGGYAFLNTYGIKSMLLVPVVSDRLWGAVSFQNHTEERDFDDDCIGFLSSAARLCANAIIKNEKIKSEKKAMEDLKRRGELMDMLNKTAVMFLSHKYERFEKMMTEGVKLITDMLDLDRVSIWRNSEKSDGLHSSQIYRWDKFLGGTTAPTPEFEDVAFAQLAPRWEKLMGRGVSINSPARLMPEVALRKHGVMSAFVTPIFINGKFWGFALFEDRREERYFADDSAEVMRSAAFLYANTVIRFEMEKELKDALERATAASKAKSEFLSNMSHEMRTPLNAIIGMTAIAENAGNMEQKNRALQKIDVASAHLLGVINDVLDIAKIEANKLELSPITYSFEEMIKKSVTVVNFRADERKQQLNVSIDPRIPRFVIGDDKRLNQVITNLLANAVKFTPDKGEVSLRAFLENENEEYCLLRIEVSDNGIGISPDEHDRLFSAFEQADSGTSRKYGGTGLGLIICKRIVELMGGRIWFESELNKGATFIFTVRVLRGEDNSLKNLTKNNKTTAKGEFEGKRLLIAEDIDINREILISLLENTGLRIECAEDGKEALDMVSANPGGYDVIFMDIQMPRMDGLEAARQIRALPDFKGEPPIIAMTASVFKDDINTCLEAGMNDHLGKPLEIDKVLEKLRKYLQW